ncbi:unnamed protein product [Paramecium octaurelia]|uniref:Protein OS9-like domain-containing protein n=1 Tax=Paramecium octaurelia TaxID=43137 RepID=A0A8S1T6X3_PAROT|nr:unnamed protein product [Paramecium octaurelia]
MLIILIYTIAHCFQADNTYVTHVFDKAIENNYTRYPELFAVQNIYDSVSKQITLKNGRKVLCQIPIPQITKPFQIDKLTIVRNLTDEEVNHILFPLEDQCVQHYTKEFVYEYCFKKYIRQFDDLNTMLNMRKQYKEDFSLGISKSYLRATDETNGIHQPDHALYTLDTNYHQIINQVDQLIIISECIAKLRNYTKILLKNYGYKLTVNTITATYHFEIALVIHSQLLLLKQCSDQTIISDSFEFQPFDEIQEKILPNQYYQYKNIIFGMNLRAQEMFHPQQSLGVVFTEHVHIVQVEKIIDFCAILVSGNAFRKKPKPIFQIKNLILMDTNAVYVEMKRPVLIIENILFFEWVDQMDINDYVTIFENSTSVFSYVETFKIVGYQNGMATLDKQLTKGLRYSGKAFIKRNGQFNYAENITLFQQNSSEGTDEDYLDFYKIEHDQIQLYLFNNSQQGIKIKQEHQKFNGITFHVSPLKSAQAPSLFINIRSQMYEETHISFLTVPQHTIFIKSKSRPYKQMEPRYMNSSIMSEQFWIIIDTQTDKLYIGKDYEIDLFNRMIEFQLLRIKNTTSPIIFDFTKKSNEVKVLDIMLLPLKNFQNFESNFLNGTYHPLNYTGQGQGQYFESYDQGSYCKPINSTRKSIVQLRCYPGDLMRFLSIYEEEICQYKINIGTYLLCENNQDIVEPSEQHIMCILNQ